MFGRVTNIIIPNSELEINGLRVNFHVEKSLIGYPNLANIKIYNLSESSRNKLDQEGLEIELYAGYEDTNTITQRGRRGVRTGRTKEKVIVPLLFKGDIINAVSMKQGVDWITEVFAGDGSNLLNNSTVNMTLAAGATTETIYNTLVAQMEGIKKGVTEGIQNCLSGKKSLLKELVLSGNVKDWLEKLSKQCGFDYSVNDGVIETFTKNQPVSDEPPILINQKSGMIGSPERSEIGVNVKNLLVPTAKLARTFKIESISERVNVGNLFFRKVPPIKNEGVYRIEKLTHDGDTRENSWQTDFQGRIF